MNPVTTHTLSQAIAEALPVVASGLESSSRKAGSEAFVRMGFPGPKNEEFRFTPITRQLEKNFKVEDFTITTPAEIENINEFLIPGYECNIVIFVNGRYDKALSKVVSPENEITILPLTDELLNDADASRYFSSLETPSQDSFTALNAAAWTDGLFIKVPDHTVVYKPIFILHLHDATHRNVVSQTRILAIVGEGSEVSITEKFDTLGQQPVFNSVVEEIAVLKKATLNYHRIQNDAGQLYHIGTTRIHQFSDSRVNTFTLTLSGQLIRNNLGIIVDGEKCESHFYGLYLLDKNTLADNHTVVDHVQPNSYSNELYKGIMDGNSKGVFNGKIYVRPHAQKTNAFQSNRNILLSDSSTVNTKPQLEIWADDVKCSHGCTSGQLDEEALFYLQSRGISRHIAKAMVLNAFAGEVFNAVKDQTLKGYIDTLVSGRLQKNH